LCPARVVRDAGTADYYAGNQAAVRRWSGSEGKRIDAIPAYLEERRPIESELGAAIGITKTFDLGYGRAVGEAGR
jgi:hypothetical protein